MVAKGWCVCMCVCVFVVGVRGASVNASSNCYHIVGDLVGTQKEIAEAESQVSTSLSSFPVYTSFDCKRAIRNFLCLGSFISYGLIQTSSGETAGLCSEVCSFVKEECADLLAELSDDNVGGQILNYELANSCADTSGCVSANTSVVFEGDYPQCPFPLVVPESSNPSLPITGTGCAFPCPIYYLTAKEWDSFFTLYACVTYVGFFAALYMVIKTVLDSRTSADGTKKPGAWSVAMFSLGCFIVAIGAMILVISDPRKQICANNAEADTYNKACVAQGYLYVAGSMWASAWGCCSSFELFMKIVRQANRVQTESYRRWYLPLASAFSLWTIVIAASSNAIGYQLQLNIPTCFFFATSDTWAQWAGWYGPQTLLTACTLVFMITTMVTMTQVVLERSSNEFRSVSSASEDAGAVRTRRREQLVKVIQYNLRPFLFVTLFVLVMLYLLAFRYSSEVLTDALKNSATEHITCLLTEGVSDAAAGTAACGILPKFRLPYTCFAFVVIFLSAYSLIPLFVYGISYQVNLVEQIRSTLKIFITYTSTTQRPPHTNTHTKSRSNTHDTGNHEFVEASSVTSTKELVTVNQMHGLNSAAGEGPSVLTNV